MQCRNLLNFGGEHLLDMRFWVVLRIRFDKLLNYFPADADSDDSR